MKRLLLWTLVAACSDTSPPPAHVDAAIDAAVDASAIDAPFSCGTSMSCDKTTQYCYVLSAGAVVAGVLAMPSGCTALPAACGSHATCACITPTITDCSVGVGLTCEEHDGAVTATCNLP